MQRILLSRTDSIGDVILTLPMAGIIKKEFPNAQISFLGKNYTKDIVASSIYVDEFISYDDLKNLHTDAAIRFIEEKKFTHCIHVFPQRAIAALLKRSKIPIRIGTTNRWYHWLTCNKLIRLSRKNSDLHEAQLNLILLSALGLKTSYTIENVKSQFGFEKIEPLSPKFFSLLDNQRKNIIIHPKSQGSATEWTIENYVKLIKSFSNHEVKIFISGTENERLTIQPILNQCPEVVDLVGKIELKQFISFINSCDALIACSTGPLHIAAVTGKLAIGLFTDVRPMHPGRWAPLGSCTQIVLMKNNPQNEIQEIQRIINSDL